MDEIRYVTGLVSIVIPTYNQSEFLRQAIDCIINQTYGSWEAIVVNNFSTDETISVVEGFNDRRVSLINFSNDGVIARSRNLAISRARGEFVAFLDSDDLWEPTKLERSVERLKSGADLVCHAERWFGGDGPDRIVQYGPASRATYDSLLLNGNCISTSATVVRHAVLADLGGFRDHHAFITTEDYDLWLRIARAGFKLEFIDDVLGSFRRHQASASSAPMRHLHAELAIIEDHFQANSPRLDPSRRSRTALAYYAAGRACTRGGFTREGFELFLKSLKLNPRRLRAWVGLIVHLAASSRRRTVGASS